MKTLAIIAEYNPFHNGHLHHLKEAFDLTRASFSIALMGGNFLQRGQAAIADKYTRACMCVNSGIDLALELPFPYATGSAYDFSMGAVNILNKLNTVDYLCFGAENPDIDMFYKIADILCCEPLSYKNSLKNHLSGGLSYPAARTKALKEYFGSDEISEFISSPNNILGIEYVKAILKTGSTITPIAIQRKSAAYHDKNLYNCISSATAIRDTIKRSENNLAMIKNDIPPETFSVLESTFLKKWPVYTNYLTPFFQSALINNSDFSHICDISPDLSNKLLKLKPNADYDNAIDILKSKNYTSTRLSRSIIHLIIGYTESNRTDFINNNYALYANMLGLKKSASTLMRQINQKSEIPVINKKADFNKEFDKYNIDSDIANLMWNLDTKATSLYNCLIFNSLGYQNTNDYTTKTPVV